MPYRSVIIATSDGAERHLVRISDRAIRSWVRERARLRAHGYPGRPPDVDTTTMRVWLPRQGEARLPYFAASLPGPALLAGPLFPILSVSWHAADGEAAKLIVTGGADGALAVRVTVERADGERRVDESRVHAPDADPEAIWDEIETILRCINEAPMAWGKGDPLLTTYPDFLRLDRLIDEAAAEARTAGLLDLAWAY